MPGAVLQNVREAQARRNEETRCSILLGRKAEAKSSRADLVYALATSWAKTSWTSSCHTQFQLLAFNQAKKVSNHSVRKTSIERLLDANFPENYVMQLSGHKNIQSLSAYKSASLGHQRQMSDALSGRKESATASSSDVNSADSVKVPSVTSIGYSSSSNALEAVFAGANRDLTQQDG